MKRFVLFTLAAVILLSGTAGAFDGARKGFVLGGGLGLAATADYDFDFSVLNVNENGAGLGLNFVIGYAWDEKNMIVYEGNVAGWKSDYIDESVGQGFNGASWYHYFGPAGKSLFTTAGMGFYVFRVQNYDSNDPGFGLLLGGGYEFAPHWQVGAYFSAGKTKEAGTEMTHKHFNILVSGVAF